MVLELDIDHMAGLTKEVHPYKQNVTKSCSKQSFSWANFFTKLPESFCSRSRKGSVQRIGKNIFKVSQVRNFCFLLAMTSKIIQGHKKWNISSTYGRMFMKFDT